MVDFTDYVREIVPNEIIGMVIILLYSGIYVQ